VSVDVVEVVPDKGIIGKKYRKEAKPLMERLAVLTKTQIEDLEKSLTDNGQVFYNIIFVIILIFTIS
jgi:glycyl-tRNA synthetase